MMLRIALSSFVGECDNIEYASIPNPDESYRAVIFQRDCGATTGFNTQISILQFNDDLTDSAGNIFIIDGHPKDVAPTVSWASENTLIIHHVLDGSEYKSERVWGWFGSVTVNYSTSGS
ncbi:hypothetical protein [Ferrimonas sp. SCSIO 43195]|uniref:hypothetical protein n=1 Tax=Ferrimonas sp. SCSIO 43195 TaxID=2822844 RepID=UPI002074E03F|nr:hypothetical protein [Ferrimonas sp. SCSIO 43195]USD35837.1 hypothetical protein J8Z22_12360 [Ferrimonas sp. SCSIO 43195]